MPRRPPAIDLAFAGALTAAGLAAAATGDTELPRAVTVALTLLYSAPLALRRRAPLAVPLLTLATIVTLGLIDEDGSQPAIPLGIALATFTLGRHARRPAADAAAAAVVAAFEIALVAQEQAAADAVGVALLLGVPFAAGRLARNHEEHRDAATRAAVAEERARLARELHDVVSHSISVVTLQTQAVRHRLGPEHAAEADDLRAVETTARQAMAELRRLLGVLRAPGDERAPLAPQPGLDQLPRLVERVRASGLRVRLQVEGEPAALSPGVDLTAYRVLQEALTNATRHAAGAATTVHVRYGPADLELCVEDRGGAAGEPGTGHGLTGMRERVELYGGRLETGPRAEGGYRVRAVLPVREGAAA